MLPTTKAGRYTLADAIDILRDLPHEARSSLFRDELWCVENQFIQNDCDAWDDDFPDQRKNRSRDECRALLIDRLNERSARAICVSVAKERLGQYLKRLCELPHVSFRDACAIEQRQENHYSSERIYPEGAPWYFANVADALLVFMTDRAEKIRSRIADTEVTQLITRWIRKCRNIRQGLMIIGNSRFGKTEAVKMNAEMAPGNCRLVQTPDSTAIGDLLREVARALGLEVNAHNQTRELRERIEYVLRYSGLQLIFDESQMLLPGAFSRNTAPARLNWVRRSMMDRDIPVVFVCTPQSYLPAKKRFVAATGFAMEQFDERVLKTIELPKELSEADLLAVTRIHFPNQRDEYLQLVVDHAISTERNFVSDIGKIALLAKDNAQEAGRKSPIFSDIEAAMADVLPTPRKPATFAKAIPQKPSHSKRLCSRPAGALQRRGRDVGTLPISTREPRHFSA